MVDPPNPAGATTAPTPFYSTSTNSFNNLIDLLTTEGISVWRSATKANASAKQIVLSVENGDKLVAQL